MAPAPVDDGDLVERVRRGELDAFGTLVQRYQDLALRVAYLITGDFAEAEDATQEAFLKVYASLDRFRLDAPFRPWVLRIVANEARNVRTATRRRAGLLARSSDQLPARGHAPSPEGAVLANEQHRVLVRALADLREDDRLAISYRYFFDLSESEMVSALGWSRGTVKSRLSRALGRYRRRLGELALLPIGVFAFPDVARTLAGLEPAELPGTLSDLGSQLAALPAHELAQALPPGSGAAAPSPGQGGGLSAPAPALARRSSSSAAT